MKRIIYYRQVFSTQEVADNVIPRLDRTRIFPPFYYNQPRDFVVSTQQGHVVKSNCFLFCRKNVKEEASRYVNGNMQIINKITGTLWRTSSKEEKDIYRDLYTDAKNLSIQMNATAQQPIVVVQAQIQPPNPEYETISNMYNTGFTFNTMEDLEFSSILDSNLGPETTFH
ncbi:hypothetical protein C1645_731282 [Glomus cerebriforme]|uniref:HMG box domain-containing protein n=1 Tax=Glomus cerebriforme TaxID=658196 RepID=A0A397TLS7_9GLOM|nr:hypothetical protein C1645_731282 [Glomus cerebriforme]